MKQGITGFVKEISGNQMPSPGVPPAEGVGIKTTIYVYELTNLSQVDRIGSSAFYNGIRTKFIRTVDSDSTGKFSLSLPPGRYSLFTRVDDKFYANLFDQENNIAPVTVEENRRSEVNITVSARATY